MARKQQSHMGPIDSATAATEPRAAPWRLSMRRIRCSERVGSPPIINELHVLQSCIERLDDENALRVNIILHVRRLACLRSAMRDCRRDLRRQQYVQAPDVARWTQNAHLGSFPPVSAVKMRDCGRSAVVPSIAIYGGCSILDL
jgi:hypothetical protein